MSLLDLGMLCLILMVVLCPMHRIFQCILVLCRRLYSFRQYIKEYYRVLLVWFTALVFHRWGHSKTTFMKETTFCQTIQVQGEVICPIWLSLPRWSDFLYESAKFEYLCHVVNWNVCFMCLCSFQVFFLKFIVLYALCIYLTNYQLAMGGLNSEGINVRIWFTLPNRRCPKDAILVRGLQV